MKDPLAETHIISTRTYAVVWLALLALLAATLAVARLQLLARYSVLGSLLIATAKAGLVLAFFMHLKYEGRFLKGLLLLTLAALALFIGLTFADVWYR
ncbi:MAG TPA: cytochrome C oxidase subunit IV family protein [Syntrophales bacterium]